VASRKRRRVRKRVDKRAVQANRRVLRAMGKGLTPFDICGCEIVRKGRTREDASSRKRGRESELTLLCCMNPG
jgi:hypothetical protein